MTIRILLAMIIVSLAGLASAGQPLHIDIPEAVTVRKPLVTIGDVAQLSGGSREDREYISGLDLVEITGRGKVLSVSRKSIEFRIRLAGYNADEFRVSGSERVGIHPAKRVLTIIEIESAVCAELTRLLPARDAMAVQLSRPIAVKLPEVAVWESVRITGRPHVAIRGPGPVQMDVTLTTGGETLLGLPMYFEVKSIAPQLLPNTPIAASPISKVVPVSATSSEILVKARQRITILVVSGDLKASAIGEAMQDGRIGQSIQVVNIDSKKILSAKVSGPGTVEIELGGSQ